MRNWLPGILSILLLTSCEERYPGFSKGHLDTWFQHHILGEERVMEDIHVVEANLTFTTIEDTFLGKLNRQEFVVSDSLKDALRDYLLALYEGDSISVIFDSARFLPKEIAGSKLAQHMPLKMGVFIRRKFSKLEYEEYLRYLAWKRDQEVAELKRLERYLKKNAIPDSSKIAGVYILDQDTGNGVSLKYGDHIYVHYKGSFLDGTQFDSTYDMEYPFDFNLGDPDQIIKGLEIGLSTLNRLSKAKIIIPSQLAFGEYGSSTGIVPPFTTLIYEVELVEI